MATETRIFEVVPRGDEFCVLSEDGSRSFGCYPTREQANERLRQVEAAKAAKNEQMKRQGRRPKYTPRAGTFLSSDDFYFVYLQTSEDDGHTHNFDVGDEFTSPPSDERNNHTHRIIYDDNGGVLGFAEADGHGHDLVLGLEENTEDDEARDYGEIKSVEIFRTGTWNGDKYSEKDLDDMVAAFGATGYRPPVKVGHTKDSSARAFGWVDNIRRKGDKLVADFVDVPEKVMSLIRERGLDTVSAEIYWNLKRGEKVFRRALKAVALLGAEVPAVSDLAPLRTVVNSADHCDRMTVYQLKPEEWHMDKIEELAQKVTDLEKQLSEAEKAKADLEAKAAESEATEAELEDAETARKEAETQLSQAKDELTKLHKQKDDEIAKLQEQVKTLTAKTAAAEEEKRQERIERKYNACKIPALRQHLRALYDAATSSEREVEFTQGEKTEKVSPETVLDSLVDAINSQAKKLFSESTRGELDRRDDDLPDENPGLEVDKRTKAYMAEHNVTDYAAALQAVLKADPELAKTYAQTMG